MLLNDCKVQVDEVYTTKERVHKYTLIHLKKPLRITSLQKAMKILFEKYHIIEGDIVGYEAIDSNEKRKKKNPGAPKHSSLDYHSIENHVAFMTLEKDMNEKNPEFKLWKENESKPGIMEPVRKIDPLKPFSTKKATREKLINAIDALQVALTASETKSEELRGHLRDMDSLYANEKQKRIEAEKEIARLKNE
jgi:hypothetical protein